MNQLQLAKRAGLRQNTLSRIEKGKHASPRIENLQAIARALGVSLEDLLRLKPLRAPRSKRTAS